MRPARERLRTERFVMRLTTEEQAMLRSRADRAGMNVTDYVRLRALRDDDGDRQGILSELVSMNAITRSLQGIDVKLADLEREFVGDVDEALERRAKLLRGETV